MPTVFLSIGSNIQPELNFKLVAGVLNQFFQNIQWSPIYKSPAIGLQGADFLNAVISAETSESANQIQLLLKHIELEQGRDHLLPRFSSRTLDIDLLLYDQIMLDTTELTLPRNEVYSEAFVLLPLVKLAPELLDPSTGQTFKSILDQTISQNPDFIKDFELIELAL